MAVVKKISELVPKGSALGATDLLVVGVDNGTDYDLKSVTGAQLLGTVVSQTITDGDTTHSPSSNVVFDALALKVDKVTGSRLITSLEATILNNTSGTNTGDQDLSGLVTSNTSITGATKTKISYDAKGLVTNGTDATTADIADSLNKRYVTDVEKTNINYLNTVASNVQDQINAKVNLNSPLITPATKTKISYDAKGLVLSGADATTSDIADSLNKRYVTDANLTTIGNTSGTNTGDQIISDATLTTTDITTNNFSTTKHGFVPKGTNTGKYLKDDGTWGAISAGGLTYFTEAQNTTAPNATVNVDSLTAIASTTNADVAIVPKGTGAFTLAIPDSLSTGGNKRGTYALDLQMFRSANAQVASGSSSVSLGASNTASGTYSTVGGGQNNVSSGSHSFSTGSGNTASGGSSIAMGASNGATNDNSIGIGIANTASGYRSASIGTLNSMTGTYTFAFGVSNTSSRSNAVAIGSNNTAGGDGSIAIGSNVNTFLQHGRISFSSGLISIAGDIQKSFYILKGRTTDATPKTLTSDNGGVSTASILVLQNNNVIRFKGSIVGKQTGTTNVGVWDIDGVIVRGANASATTLPISNINIVTNASAWGTPTLTADTTLGGLTLNAVGLAGTNIQWIASFETSEVIY